MSPNEPARRQTDLAGVKLMLGWVRAAGFDSILATGNDAVETWRVRARCLHAPEAALTFCVLMLLAASQATPGPRVQSAKNIISHACAPVTRTSLPFASLSLPTSAACRSTADEKSRPPKKMASLLSKD